MKIRKKIVMCVASVLKVHVSLKNEKQVAPTIQGKEQPQVILTDEKEIKLWDELSSQLKDCKKYILLTDEVDVDRWESFKANIPSDKESSPISMVAYKNIIHSLYRALDDSKLLPEGKGKEYVISDVLKSFKNCGINVVNYDGNNLELFEVKEDCECIDIEMATPTLRSIKTGEIIIKGVVFIPEKK